MKRPSLTIGIPAYNESTVIGQLIRSIQQQVEDTYILKKIIVFSDGSTDSTLQKIARLQRNDKRIKLVHNRERQGKVAGLNTIYQLTQTDLLLTLDADIVLGTNNEISKMVSIFNQDPEVCLVAAHNVPYVEKTTHIMGKVILTNYQLWNQIRVQVNGGDSVYNLFGCASMLRHNLVKAVRYPDRITCDQGYLYFASKRYGKFIYAGNTLIYHVPISSLSEYRAYYTRSAHEVKQLVPHFDFQVEPYYRVPTLIKVKVIAHNLMSNPLFTILAISLNYYLKITAGTHSLSLDQGIWETAKSTKRLVYVNG